MGNGDSENDKVIEYVKKIYLSGESDRLIRALIRGGC